MRDLLRRLVPCYPLADTPPRFALGRTTPVFLDFLPEPGAR
ncbi:MAG: hypothetical protein WCI61_00125 [Chloroflexota bacterium]